MRVLVRPRKPLGCLWRLPLSEVVGSVDNCSYYNNSLRASAGRRILWSLVVDSLLTWLIKQGVFAEGYADDGCILVFGQVLSIMSEIMQRILRGVENGCA